ncbi:TPA: structural cement protein Gp24 [Burkholderia cepacia]
MPSLQAYQYRMPAGFAGDLQRAEVATIEPQLIDPAAPPTAFGVPVKMVNGKIQPINNAADTAALVYGVNLRAYPIQGNGNDPLGTSTPPTSGPTDILKRGYFNAALGGTTPATKNGTVYVRVAAAAAGKPLGGFEAAADGTNTVAMPSNWYFNGPADAYGIAEIAVNI